MNKRLMAVMTVLLVTAAAIPVTRAGNLTSAPSAAPRMSSPSLSPGPGLRAMPSATSLNTDLDFRVPKAGSQKNTQDRARTLDRPAPKQAQAPTRSIKKRFKDLQDGKTDDMRQLCASALDICIHQPDPRDVSCMYYMQYCDDTQ